MDGIVMRAVAWLVVAFAAVGMSACAIDQGFAIQMGIVALAAFVAAFYAMRRVGNPAIAADGRRIIRRSRRTVGGPSVDLGGRSAGRPRFRNEPTS